MCCVMYFSFLKAQMAAEGELEHAPNIWTGALTTDKQTSANFSAPSNELVALEC